MQKRTTLMTDIKDNTAQVQITVTTNKKHSLNKETVLYYTFDQASGFGFSGWGAAVGASVGF